MMQTEPRNEDPKFYEFGASFGPNTAVSGVAFPKRCMVPTFTFFEFTICTTGMGDTGTPPTPKDTSPQGEPGTQSSHAQQSSDFAAPQRLPTPMPSPIFWQGTRALVGKPSIHHSPLPRFQHGDPAYVSGMPQNFDTWRSAGIAPVPITPAQGEWHAQLNGFTKAQDTLDKALGDRAIQVGAHARAPTMYAYKQDLAHASFTRVTTLPQPPSTPVNPEKPLDETKTRSPSPPPPESLLCKVTALKSGE